MVVRAFKVIVVNCAKSCRNWEGIVQTGAIALDCRIEGQDRSDPWSEVGPFAKEMLQCLVKVFFT